MILQVRDAPLAVDPEPDEAAPLAGSSETAAAAKSAKRATNRVMTFPPRDRWPLFGA
jgi:hypothetical protein